MNNVAKNATWIIACKMIQAIVALVINILTARYLGPEKYGLITYATSLVAFVVPLMQLGFSDTLVQEIINNPQKEGELLGTAVLFSAISSICCIIGITVFSFVANPNEPSTIIVCALYSILLIFQAFDLIQYWFQAKLMSKYTSIISLGAYLVVAVYQLLLLVLAKGVYWFAISNTINYAIIAVGSVSLYKKKGTQPLSFSKKLGKDMFSRSKHYILAGMMVTVFAQTDKIMIKLMLGKTATGYYGAAITCAGMAGFVATGIIDSFRPSILEGKKTDEKVFENRLAMLYSIITYLALVQSLAFTVFAPLIIRIIYGANYSPAVAALQIVVWYTTFCYMGAVRNIWILANNKHHYLWKINMLGALANVVLNAILIPIYGIYGASVASLITQIFTNVIVGYIIRPISPNNAIMVKGLNPRYLLEAFNQLKLSRKK